MKNILESLERLEGEGGEEHCERGMDIFWNNTLSFISLPDIQCMYPDASPPVLPLFSEGLS